MPITRRRFLTLLLSATLPGVPAAVCAQIPSEPLLDSSLADAQIPYPLRENVQLYIESVSQEYGLSRDFITSVLSAARHSPKVAQLMTPKPKKPGAAPTSVRGNWSAYRKRMVNPERVSRGVKFLEENAQYFDAAEDQYGIPRDIIAAVIGVETIFGRNQGKFPVLNTLCTLSFDYLRRSAYYQSELTQFLLLVKEQGFNPATVLGSYAGAIGMGQFMPSSIRRYAVDFDHDGQVSLTASEADAIGSVANYLASHGWVRGLPAYLPCTTAPGADLSAVDGGLKTTHTLSEVIRAGFVPGFETQLPDDEPIMVVDLPYRDSDGSEKTLYRLGTRNFQSILTYNHSYFYAAAVSDLASEIESASAERDRAVQSSPP